MQTDLADFIKHTPQGREADAILRACVHCGFCTATCPTYQLLGDELDGPRGRIYLIKQVLEGAAVTAKTQLHLDRCLTCRACETTCPSGVQYGHLLDIGREVVEQRVKRDWRERLLRFVLRKVVPRRALFSTAFKLGQMLRPLLPPALAEKLTASSSQLGAWPHNNHSRKMLVLAGCVQPTLAPVINAASARVLDRLGIELIEAPGAGCCGALRFHLNAQEAAREDARRNIDAWWSHIEKDCEAIVMTASGCGVMVEDYGHLLSEDADYAHKAARVSLLTRDIAEVIAAELEQLERLLQDTPRPATQIRVAFQSPCTLQHGQKIHGAVEQILRAAGFDLAPVAGGHLCCGSAGAYSLLQPELSRRLRENKLSALEANAPQMIVTANIGCLTHLQSGTALPVRHWIEALAGRVD